jgi:hypothetical protein
MPTEIIGHMGLPVGMIGTDNEDEEGHIVMRVAEQMNFNAMFFLSGIEDWKRKFELGGPARHPKHLRLITHSRRSCLLVSRGHVRF